MLWRFKAGQKSDLLPSIVDQTPWLCGFYDFGKAKIDGVDYFNPTLYQRPDGRWLITRRSKPWSTFRFGINDIMAFKLDHNVPLYGIPVHIPTMLHGEHFEDPRIVTGASELILSMTNFIVFNGGQQWTGAHQMLCNINKDWMGQRRFDPVFDGNGPTVSSNQKNQKNWLWFMHDGAPHMVYWTKPHTVVRFTQRMEMQQRYVTIDINENWKWGEPRGGTPPILIDNEYWTFFHSSLPWRGKQRHYHMGAYAFESKPPFRITRMTSRPLLSGSQKDPWNEGKPLVVFPCGTLFNDGMWTVSMGVNDLVSAWIEIPHKALAKLCHLTTVPPPPEPEPCDEAIFI